MIANYHTHTSRCNHASGKEEEYIQNAIKGGLKILGFADHTPYWFPGDYYSTFRMRPEELGDYVRTLTDLREKYADKLQLHIGVEAEYYPAYFDLLKKSLRDGGVEYMILGQHFPGNEIGEKHTSVPTAEEAVLARFCDQMIDAIHTGAFTYVAHPDVQRFIGEDAVYRKHVRRVCQAAKSCDTPIEINFLGLREGRYYPDNRLWEVAGEEGCKVVFGADAHSPDVVVDPKTEQRAMEMVKTYGLNLIETVSLRKF